MRITGEADLAKIAFGKDDLVPVITQCERTGEVLMLAYCNEEAVRRALASAEMWYYSRSRSRLWRKGETSGNIQLVKSIHIDCDGDTLLALVEPTGPSCHTGTWCCFETAPIMAALDNVLAERAANPEGPGYTRRLLNNANLRSKKLGEEAVELALAAHDGCPAKVAEEAADLIYHTLVAARGAGVGLADIAATLGHRRPTEDSSL